MPKLFCSRCHKKMMDRLRLEMGPRTSYSVNEGECAYACKIPLYEMDEQGRPIVKIWDCVNNRTLFFSQAEWEKKKRDGEV